MSSITFQNEKIPKNIINLQSLIQFFLVNSKKPIGLLAVFKKPKSFESSTKNSLNYLVFQKGNKTLGHFQIGHKQQKEYLKNNILMEKIFWSFSI